MKRILLASLLVCSALLSGFVALDLRPTYSFEIFQSPYYRILKKTQPEAGARIGFVPVMLDGRAAVNPTFSDARIPELLQAMNVFMADSMRLVPAQLPAYTLGTNQKPLPDLFLGSVLGPQRPEYIALDCPEPKTDPEYCIRIGGQLGSKAWMEQLRSTMINQNLDYMIVYQLGEGYIYPNGRTKRRNTLMETRKAPPAGLDMGTGFWLPMSQKWVGLNKPIDVLFLKGMLLNKEGKALRLGAEGITAASKARFLEQAINISHEFSEEELNSIEKDLRRDDLPGRPLNWQEASRQLAKTLTSSNLPSKGGYVVQ